MSEANEDPQNPKVRALFIEFRIGEGQGVMREAIHGQAVKAAAAHLEGRGAEVEVYELILDMAEVRARGKRVSAAIPELENGSMVVTIGSETRHFRNPYDSAPEPPATAPTALSRKARLSMLSRLRRSKKRK